MWTPLKYLKVYNNIINILYLLIFIYFKIFKANPVYLRKFKHIKTKKGKQHKIWNREEQTVAMGPLDALPTHHLFTPLKLPMWNPVTNCSRAGKLAATWEHTRCYGLLLEKGCELMGAIAKHIQSPEERRETEEKSADSFQ